MGAFDRLEFGRYLSPFTAPARVRRLDPGGARFLSSATAGRPGQGVRPYQAGGVITLSAVRRSRTARECLPFHAFYLKHSGPDYPRPGVLM